MAASVVVCKKKMKLRWRKKKTLSQLSLFPPFQERREEKEKNSLSVYLSRFDLFVSDRAAARDAGSCRDEREQEYRWRSDATVVFVAGITVVVGGVIGNASSDSANTSCPSPRRPRRHGYCSALFLRSSSSAHVRSRSLQAARHGEEGEGVPFDSLSSPPAAYAPFPSSSSGGGRSSFSFAPASRKRTASSGGGSSSFGSSPNTNDTPPPASVFSEAARKTLFRAADSCRKVGWGSFWTQLALSIASAGILLFSVAFTAQNGPAVSLSATLFGVVASFLSTFWTYGYTRLARRLRALAAAAARGGPLPADMVRKGDVVATLRAGCYVNLAGLAATLLGLQATVGLLVAKTLTNATANPFLAGGAGSYSPVLALDVFLVQASTNMALAHFVSLVASLWLIKVVGAPVPAGSGSRA